MKVETSETIEGSAWGAVLIGMESIGIESTQQTKTGKTYFPNSNNKEVYDTSFTKFKKVYSLLKEL